MRKAVITGANRGIGLALTKQLVNLNYYVFALCRQSSEELEELDHIHVIEDVDIRDPESIIYASQKINGDRIDILINNAGLLERVEIEMMGQSEIESAKAQFEVNALGPVVLTSTLLSKLQEGSKIALLTSRMGSIDDNSSGSHYGYRMSKAALNMAGRSMAIDLKSRGIAVAILHPGWIQTGMTGYTGHNTPEVAAKQLLERIQELTMDSSGTFWHANGDVLPW